MANEAPLLLDATRLIWRRWAGRVPTGIDRVCLAYFDHFAGRAQAVVQHRRFRRIFDGAASQALFRMLLDPPRKFRIAFAGAIARHLRKSGRRGDGRLYLNLGHTGLDSDGFRRWVKKADVAPIYFVHDLIPITHPHFCRSGESDRHRARMRTVLETASGVIANSEATLDDLRAFASQEDLPFPPAVAAWLGVSPAMARKELSQPQPSRATFVVLGTIEARKNHLLLLNLWTKLVVRLAGDAPRLLILGQRGWEADDVFALLDCSDQLRGHVVEINDCDDAELARHMAGARALLFPSWAEGFGLPLAEALAMGVPVIASDIPALREIGQGVPMFLDPADADAWQAAILEFAHPDSEARAEQLRRMSDFRTPTWEDHFRRVEEWLSGFRVSSPAARP